MTIFEQAEALGKAIRETKEYKRFEKAELMQSMDSEAMELVNSYNKKRTELGKKISTGNPTKEDIENIRDELNAEFAKLRANKTVNEYIEANKEYSEVVEQINAIITHYASGEESGCTGSCETCGACHH